jgi:hypothetical protein
METSAEIAARSKVNARTVRAHMQRLAKLGAVTATRVHGTGHIYRLGSTEVLTALENAAAEVARLKP